MCAGVGAGLNGQPASLMRDSCMGRSADVDALDLSPEAGPPLQQLSVEVGAAECFHMPFSISVLRGTGSTLMRFLAIVTNGFVSVSFENLFRGRKFIFEKFPMKPKLEFWCFQHRAAS
jgi:hypothetical protein